MPELLVLVDSLGDAATELAENDRVNGLELKDSLTLRVCGSRFGVRRSCFGHERHLPPRCTVSRSGLSRSLDRTFSANEIIPLKGISGL
jgi:hypothetical protein